MSHPIVVLRGLMGGVLLVSAEAVQVARPGAYPGTNRRTCCDATFSNSCNSRTAERSKRRSA